MSDSKKNKKSTLNYTFLLHITVTQTCQERYPMGCGRVWVIYYACESPHKGRNTKVCVCVPIIRVLWSMDSSLTFENPPAGGDQDVWCSITLVFLEILKPLLMRHFVYYVFLWHWTSELCLSLLLISTSEWKITAIIKARNRKEI